MLRADNGLRDYETTHFIGNTIALNRRGSHEFIKCFNKR